MTDADKKKRSENGKVRYSDEDRLMAYKVWLDADRPSIRELATILEDRGFKVHHSTLLDWATKNADWAKELVDKTGARTEQILSALSACKKEATKIDVDHFIGVKANLVGRLYMSLRELPLKTIEEWTRGLDCLDRIEAYIHSERGKAVGESGPNVVTSLMERLTPNVSLPPFKKANGNGTANGGGH